MFDLPFTFTLPMPQVIPSRVDNHIEKRLSALRGQFFDQDTYNNMLSKEDQLVCDTYEIRQPEIEGEFLMGISIVNRGSLGGPAYIKASKGPFPYIPMMTSGGVRAYNVVEWFSTGVVAIGVGSELCSPQFAKQGKFAEITRQEAGFVRVVKSARV
jgi:hypothetical protein